MGSLFRSEEMTLCQLFLHTESAYMCISELGEIGIVQFRDTTPGTNAFQRKFVNEVRRCDEMERKLRFLEKEIKKDEIPILDTEENPPAPAPREMIDLEATFEKLENELTEVNGNAEQLKRNFLELTELKHVLRKAQSFFEEDVTDAFRMQTTGEGVDNPNFGATALTTSFEQHLVIPLESQGPRQDMRDQRIEFVTGVIQRERLPSFERMLWRACRGNVFLKTAEIEMELEEPVTGDKVHKSVFIIFFQGEQLKVRVKKICEGFHASVYPCPDAQEKRRETAIGVATRIEDLQTVINQTQDHRHRVLVAAAKNIRVWFLKVRKIKAIYHILNLFNLDVTAKCMIGECWCAVDDLDMIHLALRRGTERSNSSVQPILNRMTTREPPPTYHRINKFTSAFQNIVDAYGVARYREANPALFTVITFPFLFAVMFGDAGHGTLMFLFALWMVLCERKLIAQKSDNEIWNTFFGGRYIILLMGLFSMYTGMVYNDIFSKSFNIFGSAWYPVYDNNTIHTTSMLQLNPNASMYSGNPYPFGVDPIWMQSKNKITFSNSIKMKMSIILGVSQMLFGVFLSLLNHLFYRDYLSIFCEFIPQVLFLVAIFGYLIVLIFIKWIMFTEADSDCAPSLLIGLINMFMFKMPEKGDTTVPCSTWPFIPAQGYIQAGLVILAALCVPWMLLIKPFVLRHRHLREPQHERLHDDGGDGGRPQSTITVEPPDEGHDGEHEEPFEFGEAFVHQCIHTIEYCLGCISNTASYLRLWALSLAHGQLSEVLWNMVLKIGLSFDQRWGSIILFAIFAFWAVLTIAVLLLMEGLSAFLHALRLHWVEFQNKFYSGTGYKFIPFSFQQFTDITSE